MNAQPPDVNPPGSSPIPIDLRTVLVLFHAGNLLLLRRAPWKRFAPDRWTGIGGKVEPNELADLTAAALRELFEETDLRPDEVIDVRLRRTLTFAHPEQGLVTLLYFSGVAATDRLPACNEGSLSWIAPAALPSLDLIDNTAVVLPLVVEDFQDCTTDVSCGVARYDAVGRLLEVIF
jgi:8-oxo-dGTP diphosphatase